MIFFRAILVAAVMAAANLFADGFFTYEGEPVVEPIQLVIASTNSAVSVPDKIRLADWNIETLDDGIDDDPERTPEIAAHHAKMAAAMLDKINADVVVLEEVENAAMLEMLNRSLSQPYPHGYVTKYGTGGLDDVKLNDGVLSRYPLTDAREIDFGAMTGPGRPTRGLNRFTIDLGEGHKLLVYGMHLKSNFGNKARNVAERSAALRILKADADASVTNEPETKWEIIATGDTNMDPDGAQFAEDVSFEPLNDWIDLFRQVPAEKRTTMATRLGDPDLLFPPACFDRFFVTPEMTNAPWQVSLPVAVQEGCETNDAHAKPGVGMHVSDHYPVYLEISK